MLCPVSSALGRLWDRPKQRLGDLAFFEIPPQPLGHVLLRGTPRRVCTRDTGLRTCRRTPCPAWRSRMEPPVAAARLRPATPDARAPIEPAEWGDIRIAPAYPPGSASPGRRRAFGIPQARLTGPA